MPKASRKRWGVPPIRSSNCFGLWGDTIDNIPARARHRREGREAIIQQYGTIQNAIAHADEIREAFRESLKNNVDLIRQSRELVTIACEMPITLDLSTLTTTPDRRPALRVILELEFATLAREFADAADTTKAAATVATRESGKADYSIGPRPAMISIVVVESLWTKDHFGLAIAERKAGSTA